MIFGPLDRWQFQVFGSLFRTPPGDYCEITASIRGLPRVFPTFGNVKLRHCILAGRQRSGAGCSDFLVPRSNRLWRTGGVSLPSDSESNDRHWGLAEGAGNGRPWLSHANGNLCLQKQLNQAKGFASIAVMKPEVPRSAETPRQNMLKNEAQELFAVHGSGLPLPGFSLSIAKRDPSAFVPNDVLFRDDPAIEISGKILESRLARTGRFTIHDPIPWLSGRRNLPTRIATEPKDFCAKNPGHGFFRKQELPIFSVPEAVLLVDRPSGDQVVNMRVEIQPSGVGVQHPGHRDFAAQIPGIRPQFLERGRGSAKHGIEELPGMHSGQRPKDCRDGERHQKVGNRQELFALPVEPDPGFVVLTSRAASMTAGMRQVDDRRAVGTLHDHFPGIGGSAPANGVDGPAMVNGNVRAETSFECGQILFEQACEFHGSDPDLPEAFRKVVNGLHPILIGRLGEVRIHCRGRGAGMPQDVLDKAQVDTCLDKVRGKTVSKGMNRDVFGDFRIFESCLQRLLNPAAIHVGRCGPNCFRGTELVRKDQRWMPMRFPEFPQCLQRQFGQRDNAILPPFPLADVNLHVGTVDVANLQCQALAKTQSHAVDRQKECLVSRFLDQAQHSNHLIDRQDIWNSARSGRLDNPKPLPFPVKRVIPEKLKANAINLDGAPGVGLHKIGKVGLQLVLGQAIGTLVEEPGHSPYGSTVGVDGGRSFALKFQGLQVALVKRLKPGLFLGNHSKSPREEISRATLNARGSRRYTSHETSPRYPWPHFHLAARAARFNLDSSGLGGRCSDESSWFFLSSFVGKPRKVFVHPQAAQSCVKRH